MRGWCPIKTGFRPVKDHTDQTMQLAVLADIHGNLPALEAILHKLRSETIDGWIVAGDMVNGPDGERSSTFCASLTPG